MSTLPVPSGTIPLTSDALLNAVVRAWNRGVNTTIEGITRGFSGAELHDHIRRTQQEELADLVREYEDAARILIDTPPPAPPPAEPSGPVDATGQPVPIVTF